MNRAHPHRRTRWTTWAALSAWASIAAVDALAAFGTLPWLPIHLHSLAIGACVAATIAAMLLRIEVPVRASFLDGMLTERANPGGLRIEPLPMASGDDTGGATVHHLQRRPAPRPRHRT